MSAAPREGERVPGAKDEKQEKEEKMIKQMIGQLMATTEEEKALSEDPLFQAPDSPKYKWFKGTISCFLTTRGLFIFPHDEFYRSKFYVFPFNDTRAKGNASGAGGSGQGQAIFSEKETEKVTNLDGPVKSVCDFGDWFVISSGTKVAVVQLSGESKIENRLSREIKEHSLVCHYKGREGSVSVIAFVKFVTGHDSRMEVRMFSVSDKREFAPWPEYLSGKEAPGLVLKCEDLNESTTNVVVSTDCIIVHHDCCIELITLVGRDLDGKVLTERRIINRLPIRNMFVHFVTPSEVLMVQDSMVTMLSLTSRSRVRWLLLDNVFEPKHGSIHCFMIKNHLYVQVVEQNNGRSKLQTFVISAGNKELRVIDQPGEYICRAKDGIKDVFISQVIRLEREKTILRIANKVFSLHSNDRKFSYVSYCPEVKSDGELAAEMVMKDMSLMNEAISIINMEHARIRRKEVFRECIYHLWTHNIDNPVTRTERRTRAIQLLSKFGKIGRKADPIFADKQVDAESFLQICQPPDKIDERCGWVGDIARRFLVKRPGAEPECDSQDRSFELLEDHSNDLWKELKELLKWARHRCAAALKLEEMKMIDRWLARFYIYFQERSDFQALLLEKSRNKLVECDKFEKSVEDFFGLEVSGDDGEICLDNTLLKERCLWPEYAIYCAFRNPSSSPKLRKSGESDLSQKTRIAWKIFSFYVDNKMVDFNAAEEAVSMFSNDEISSWDYVKDLEDADLANWIELDGRARGESSMGELDRRASKPWLELLLPTCVLSSNQRCTKTLWDEVEKKYEELYDFRKRGKLGENHPSESEQQTFDDDVRFYTEWLRSAHEHFDPSTSDSSKLLTTVFDKLLNICEKKRIQESDRAIPAIVDVIVAVKPTIDQTLADTGNVNEKFQNLSKALKTRLYAAMGMYGDWIEELRISNKSDAEILTMCLESDNPEAAFRAYFEKCNGSDPRTLFNPMVEHIDMVNIDENLAVIARACPRLSEVAPLLLSIGQVTAYQAQMQTLLRAVTKAETKEHEWDVPDTSGPAGFDD